MSFSNAERSLIPTSVLIAQIGVDIAESGPFKVWGVKMSVQVVNRVHQVMNKINSNVAALSLSDRRGVFVLKAKELHSPSLSVLQIQRY